jgi:type IV pilus assembly protein PilE
MKRIARAVSQRPRGFTLVETLIVVALITILAVIAVPSYQDSIRKARRTEAVGGLLDLADRMERYYADQRTYLAATVTDLMGDDKTENGHYTLSIPAEDLNAESYMLRADPAGMSQTGDVCGAYTLSSAGVKGVTGQSATVRHCW